MNWLKTIGMKLRTLGRSFFESEKNDRIFRGYFDGIELRANELVVSGWALSRSGPYDSLVLYINGQEQPASEAVLRPDVGRGLPDIPHSDRSGFRFSIPWKSADREAKVDIRLACLRGEREADSMETVFWGDMYDSTPTPPLKLIKRVDGSESPTFYLLKGAQNYREFIRLIEAYADISSCSTLLDWGCGSGRITGFFLRHSNIPHIYGCDIDAEAVKWAQEHFPEGHFAAIPLLPPTEYGSDQFDAIISFSVLTHLDRETQNAWLAEMQRILKPGGLFLATVHGVKAAEVLLSKREFKKFKRHGIHDGLRDRVLEGVAPDDYYRASFQSKDYIIKNWKIFFEILDIVEQGASHYHDIAVMRKR
ncbi:MAG: methyltransferase domain-containing protein [Candidatus Omnitrophica bacterium]|nr:methyltransferase domain-containing protein [Candidatus Omnitrophota bacterium]